MINLTTGRVGPETVATTTHFIKYISVITVQSGQGDTQKTSEDLYKSWLENLLSEGWKPIMTSHYFLENINIENVMET